LTATRQLPLPFVHAPRLTKADFLPSDGTRPALAWLARDADWPGRRLALWGGPGSGKTHLLHIWATRAGASLITGTMLRHALPDNGWAPGPLAIDDADLAPSEASLLHALNLAQEARHPVLLAARTPPARWDIRLPDLSSRLRATTAVPLGVADDAFLRTLLARLLSDRQLLVPATVQDWMLAVLPREPAALREAAARLDRAGLAAGRSVTRALAAQTLASLMHDDTGTCEESAHERTDASPPHPALF
jgi:chromosomal replication initiation ATPase DnaA